MPPVQGVNKYGDKSIAGNVIHDITAISHTTTITYNIAHNDL